MADFQPTAAAQKVIDACHDVFNNSPGAKSDCNKFVKRVCDKFNTDPFDADDNADAIVEHIRDANWCAQHGWQQLGHDPQAAKDAADSGDLVVAGATGDDVGQAHGHVVVVISSQGLHNGFPFACWGKLGAVGKLDTQMTLAFKLADLPKVSYMAKSV